MNSAYTITLAPGSVQYLELTSFFKTDLEKSIGYLRSLSPKIKIGFPKEFQLHECYTLHRHDTDNIINLEGVDDFFPDLSWENKLRAHYQLGKFCMEHKLPSCVYWCFHSELGLKKFAFEECLDAWERKAWENQDIEMSFKDSSEHVSLSARPYGYHDFGVKAVCIFKKTPFVTNRLSEMERETQHAKLEEQKAATKQRVHEEAERLRRSQFHTFVYLMEDLRNGYFKIGRSATPEKRERTLQSEVPQIVMRFSIPAEESHETSLHEHFADKRIRGEWFNLDSDDLVWIVSFLKKHGDSARAAIDHEWYGMVAFNVSSKK